MANQVRDLYLYVPERILIDFCKSHEISTTGVRKLQLAEQLVKVINAAELEQFLDIHRYAGMGSVVWFQPTRNGEPIDLNSEELVTSLRKYCGADPFAEDLRPRLERRPKVINAKLLSGNKLMIQMAHLEMRPRLSGFEIQEVEETDFSRLIIRKGSLFFEARARREKALQMAEDISSAIRCTDSGQIIFNDAEMNELITYLDASVIAAKHKHVSGDFDTTEVVVSPELGDLQASSQYTSSLNALESRRKRIQFDCTFNGDVIRVRAIFYPRTGNLVFRSYVDERVLDYVFEGVKQIKGL